MQDLGSRYAALVLLALAIPAAGCEGRARGLTTRGSEHHQPAIGSHPAMPAPVATGQPIEPAIDSPMISGTVQPLPQAIPGVPAMASGSDPGFMNESERIVLDRLSQAQIVRIKKGTGGRSLAFKLYLEGGSEGYFKPEQTFSGTLWFAEVAAHYLDRALGLGRVPPTVSRRVVWAPLAEVAAGDSRLREITVAEDGTVRGALVAWLSAPLTPARTPPGWENWLRIEPFSQYAITPYRRPAGYSEALQRFHERVARGEGGDEYYAHAPRPDRPERPAELSDMIVFDFLTINIDRWGGDNGNVLTLGRGGPLIYLDNAAGFSHGPHRRGLMDDRLAACQRFRKRTIDALEALDLVQLGQAIARDPQGPLLSPELLDGLDVRRRVVLEHTAALRKRFGDEAVLPW